MRERVNKHRNLSHVVFLVSPSLETGGGKQLSYVGLDVDAFSSVASHFSIRKNKVAIAL